MTDLHDKIINITIPKKSSWADITRAYYQQGFRHARHAAAELATQEQGFEVENRIVGSFRTSGKHDSAAYVLNISNREKPTCPSCMTTMHASSSDPLSLKWKCEDCEYSYPVVLPPAPDAEGK